MNCNECTERLGDAVDGTLPPGERVLVDAHVRTCDTCRELLNDLLDIHAAAATLDRVTPSPGLWTAIAASVAPKAAVSRPWMLPGSASFGRGLPAAAAIVVMLGAAAWFDLTREWKGWRGAGTDSAASIARSAATELQLAEQHYESAIASLQQLTLNSSTTLDPGVALDITQSLQSIDRAITDSRAALKAEPDSFVAQTSLLEALRMKVALLQETVTLMNAKS